MQLPSYRSLRWIHALASPFIGALVYSPSLRDNADFVLLVQALIFPLTAAVGLWMWLGPRWLRRAQGSAVSRQQGVGA